MPTKRTLASICLAASSFALIMAVNVTAQDRAGVVRVSARQPSSAPPVPPAMEGSAVVSPRPVPDHNLPAIAPEHGPMGSANYGDSRASMPYSGPISQGGPIYQSTPVDQGYPTESYGNASVYAPHDYSSYMQSSGGVTESPVLGRRPMDNPLFGPMLMFETNFDEGLGYDTAYHRANVRLPWHAVPGSSVLIGDLSASMSNNGNDVYSFGAVWRNFDVSRNRIFGWNAFYDMDDGRGNVDWKRIGFGVESLGKYLDIRGNGYYVAGEDSFLLNDQLVGALSLAGNNVFRNRNQTRDNAYSGFDLETGGPLPVLGRRGINAYVGGYYLDNDMGYETVGVSGRIQALVTESATVNVNYTNDDTFGVNSWVSISYTIPNYGEKAIFQPKCVRDRLADPVYRSNRIHTNVDNITVPEAVVNAKTGNPYNIVFVDPNATTMGTGTFEMPYSSLQLAANNNNAAIDIIRVSPNADDSGTNLTVNGGLALFDCQALVSSVTDYTLFSENGMDFNIPGIATNTNLGPLISNPTMGVGGSVVRLANQNTVQGMRIDAGNAAGTIFGTGITNPNPITDANIVGNVLTNYETAVNLQAASGNIIFDENRATGTDGTSNSGLVLTTGNGTLTNLLVRNNTVSNNATVGISITASQNSTLNADNPQGFAGAGNPTGQATGIVGNTVTNGGEGIEIIAQAGATANVLAEENASGTNTKNGFVARADGAGSVFNLASLRENMFDGNMENGALLHYLNGGRFFAVTEDINEDLNFNGVPDVGESLGANGLFDVANGLLDAGEDLNGNGQLDQGIVSNTFSNNTIAGLCIFGEDNGTGLFDIGGAQASLGNTFISNLGAGIAMDLKDTATAQTNVLNNLITADLAVATTPSLTFVLDFWESGQGASTVDAFGNTIQPFDLAAFGFAPGDFNMVTAEILNTVRTHYYGIPTVGVDARSSIPDGQQLAVDFVVGDIGSLPSNGATEYYTVFIGDTPTAGAPLGLGFLGAARNAAGAGPNFGFVTGDQIASVYSNNINSLGGLTPADVTEADIHARYAGTERGDLIHADIGATDVNLALNDALTSGNLTFTANALAGTISHEIGHTLSLNHIDATGAGAAVTASGVPPLMGTGAIDLSNQARIGPREFSYSGTNTEGGGVFQTHVAQLQGALGLRNALQPGISGDGILVTATDSARLLPSNIINNRIERNGGTGVEVVMNDSARAEGLTIQGNSILANGDRGIDLFARGAGAFIDASNTIGGTGMNTLAGMQFSEGNVISGNQSDGIRALASNDGTVQGNALNNIITNNVGNGIGLYVDGSGTIDFGTPASNRVISGNTITGNGGAGVELVSTVEAGESGVIHAVVQSNEISNNLSGGIISQMFGPSMDNVINLTVGGTVAQANTIAANGNVGIGFSVAGNAKGNFSLTNATISGTTDGPDPLTSGDGIYLSRASSSLLLANIENVTSSGNTGSGLRVDIQGNDKNDPNQPMAGMVNTVDWNNNLFTDNGVDGALFRVRGDAQLIADGANNVLNNNTQHGLEITTSENASFGDPSAGLPPGRRVLISGTTATGNGVDGVSINATENSRVLAEITSNRTAATSTGAHAALNTNGDTNLSNNGSDGIHITTTGGSSDILITSNTGNTTINGNGTAGGGNGIRWDASGESDALVRITKTTITNSIAGATEDPANNANGVLDPGEDINGNGILDTGEDGSNDDIDVANGDGIQFNAFDHTVSTLIVGGVDPADGNVIQNNADDGIALTATGQDIVRGPIRVIVGVNSGFDPSPGTVENINTSRPIITIANNVIGGERDGTAAGNGGDGVSLNNLGGTLDASFYLADPANIDTDQTNGVSLADGVTQSGPIVNLTLTDNLISNNGRRGVNLSMNGAGGERDREDGDSIFDPGRITLTGNTILSNGMEGVFFRGDTEMNQGRLTYLANFPFPNPPFNPADDRPFFLYDPMQAEFQGDNIGSVNGNTAFANSAPDGEGGYLNLRTVQNTFLTITGNTIQNNGVGTLTGEGLVLSVGTGAYLAADVRNNTFGGNLEEDFRTESFLSFGETYTSVDTSGNNMFDIIYHDDSAQMDLRFTGNTGNQIAISSDGATYRTRDALKENFLGFVPTDEFGVTDRDAAFFQVDDGMNLDNPNNAFLNFGATQDIDAEFTAGGFNLRGAADPLFPNIGFAPFLP
ncbi:MAG: inverse autotransporter beta domain-containing protein [Planctomycetaceae bacterium]